MEIKKFVFRYSIGNQTLTEIVRCPKRSEADVMGKISPQIPLECFCEAIQSVLDG